LQLARTAAPTTLSVTALRDWLACPFRFYLRHGLKMSRVDAAKSEIDARDFGTLLHGALQELADDGGLRDCVDASVLTDFLLARFDQIVRLRYGAELTLPLIVQFESARQRLRAAARVEARERVAGWRTERAEWTFSVPLGPVSLRGKIDRIDRHVDGRVRVLDYKTADIVKPPAQTHLRFWREADRERPDWMRCVDPAGKLKVWADLQLPLYRRAVAAEFGRDVACGYFTLPRAVGGTTVMAWTDFSGDLQASAELCAEGVAAAVAAGVFWPPAELAGRSAEWDEFAELFQRGAADSVQFDAEPGLTRHSQLPATGVAKGLR
jgi:ATP-dependent helicase/nuclease subunit B